MGGGGGGGGARGGLPGGGGGEGGGGGGGGAVVTVGISGWSWGTATISLQQTTFNYCKKITLLQTN